MDTKEFAREHSKLNNHSIEIVKRLALELMQKHKELDKFEMGMGVWFFTKKVRGDENKVVGWEDRAYIENSKLGRFLCEWDCVFRMTGSNVTMGRDGSLYKRQRKIT